MPDSNLKHLLGDPREVAVERALAEIRSGRPVVVVEGNKQLLTIAAESVDDAMLERLIEADNTAIDNSEAQLVLSPPRARLLGFQGPEPAIMALAGVDAKTILEIVSDTGAHLDAQQLGAADDCQKDALDLVRLSYLLPAVITILLDTVQAKAAMNEGLVQVEREAILHFEHQSAVEQADFETPFQEAADSYPLGEEGVLIASMQLSRKPNGAYILKLSPKQGKGVTINLDDKLMHSFMEMLIDSSKRAEWDLELRLPASDSTTSTEVPLPDKVMHH